MHNWCTKKLDYQTLNQYPHTAAHRNAAIFKLVQASDYNNNNNK